MAGRNDEQSATITGLLTHLATGRTGSRGLAELVAAVDDLGSIVAHQLRQMKASGCWAWDTGAVDKPVSSSKLRSWVSVRCVLIFPGKPRSTFEERITLWYAESMADAIALAEAEARDHAEAVGAQYTGLAQGYALVDEPEHAAEVFSLMRDSDLSADAYLDQFFDTGDERQREINGQGSR
jgi:pentatricopeptide repeat protein